MKDLLKEAIADAKAVRETALANAKLALEEAFAPRLQSIISAKMQTEMEEADDEDVNVEEEEAVASDETPEMEDSHEEEMEDTSDDVEFDEEDFEDEVEDEEDVDLEEIIRELESDEEDLEEELDSSDIGVSDNKAPSADASDSADAGDTDLFEMDDEDEEIDLDEVIAALKEEDEDTEEIEETESEKEAELEEAYNVIRYLKDKINEVNLLNAKLLYSNKLFKSYDLNENQKMKVIENFDRANNMREVKLVYTTLTESFKSPAIKKVVKEGFASKPVGSTRPKSDTVLNEGTELANRFKKLAGLIK